MATRSTIGILNEDGSINTIYCHSDGYLSFNGFILEKHYKNFEKVKKLISLGSLSSLSFEVDIPEGMTHNFEKRLSGVSTFYGRDRGEKDTNPIYHNSLESYITVNILESYNYLFKEKNKEWFLLDEKSGKLKKLFPLLVKDKTITGEDKIFLESVVNTRKALKFKKQLEVFMPEKNVIKCIKVKI